MYYTTDYVSPVGRIKLAADGERLVGLWLEGQKYFAGTVKEEMTRLRNLGFLKIQRTGWTAILRERSLSPQSFCWLPWEENSGRVYGKSSVRSPMDSSLRTAILQRRWRRG